MQAIDHRRSVGDFVTERPSCARVLERHGVDYCCGGRATLEEACRRAGADLSAVAAELADALHEDPHAVNWARAPLRALVVHIIARHHDAVSAELPRGAALVAKVASAHGDRDARLRELETVYGAFALGMARHMAEEEERVFPAACALEDDDSTPEARSRAAAEFLDAWRGMHEDHDEAGAALRIMRDLTGGFSPGPDACNTWRVMLDCLSWFERDTHRHVHLENNILFPRARDLAERVGPRVGSGA
ncbi:MAG: iron-sulfur cluster repair di-iron protein [Phycisphaerales bacterium]|nr:MAG: iron-sulfur cluster repair di-iron protein [Phycisphaerales bacterium]